MMFRRRTDLGLVAEHLLGQCRLADPGKLDRPLDIGQLADRRVETAGRESRGTGLMFLA